ncbi:protein yellow-like [Ischnura elegans]|uniref:protein yellow-like n=1 Tax=Ischnura elegans TaxID=197161 RepID=UPI001ED8BF13|nr:protein yellow-like [Ischnura elegans]
MVNKALSLALMTLALLPLATPAKMKEVLRWKQLDFMFRSNEERTRAIQTGRFHQENTLPLGLEVYGDRIFITLPRWKTGSPATLAYVQRPSDLNAPPTTPLLNPYPNWEWNRENSGCDAFTSVFRAMADSCGRLWVMDAGKYNVVVDPQQLCPPQVLVFDLKNDTLVRRFRFPEADLKDGSFFTNVAVDIRNDRNGRPICDEAYAYMSDVWRSGLVVYSFKHDKSWRVNHDFFLPDPLHCKYTVGGYTFHWTDGLFTVAMGPVDTTTNDRMLYFHAMSSDKEFAVPASTVRNSSLANSFSDTFKYLGSRGQNGHSSASAMDKDGILFYNLVTRNAVGCWNSKFPYRAPYLGEVDISDETLVFPNDLKVDQGGMDGFTGTQTSSKRRRQTRTQGKQNLWVLSNKLQAFLYGELDKSEYNFRILALPVEDAIKDNSCHPDFIPSVEDLPARFGCDL